MFCLVGYNDIVSAKRIVDHLEKCGLFSDFQYGFRSSRSTADLLTVVSDRIARAFGMSGATRAVALDISKAFDRVWHAGLLHKLKSYGISGQIFRLISTFLSNRRLRDKWNEDKCRCECKELIDKGICDKGFIWSPSSSECQCDKFCDIGEYLDYKNCKFRSKLVDKLVEECSKNIDGNKMLHNETLDVIPLND